MTRRGPRGDPRLLQGVADLQFVKPTVVQAACIPLALRGKDVLARAQCVPAPAWGRACLSVFDGPAGGMAAGGGNASTNAGFFLCF